MNLHICYEVDHLQSLIATAAHSNNQAELQRLSQALERAAGVIKSWSMGSGGKATLSLAALGVLEVPAEKMAQLPEVRRQFESLCSATISIGVGMELNEAYVAMQVAQRRGGDQIALYMPEMENELAETDHLDKAEGPPAPPEPQQSASDTQPPPPGDEPSPEPAQEASGPPNDAQEAPSDPKAAVVQALNQLKGQKEQIEHLKETNPEAYKAIVSTIQAMILMAQGIADEAPEGAQKSEESFGESHPPEESSSAEAEELDKNGLPMPKKPLKRQHIVYPVGAIKEGKIKVAHMDPQSKEKTGEGWSEVRSGQVLSEDGHATSSRDQNGK